MLTITKQSDYGLLFIGYLIDKKKYVPISELIAQTKLPQRFLARIAATLVKNNIVDSREGKVGGYKLKMKFKNVSLYKFLLIFEKEVALCSCSDSNYCCEYEQLCYHKSFMKKKLNKILTEQLKKYTLSDLFKNK